MTKAIERYDMTIIEHKGSTGWNSNIFRTYLIFGRYWLHINKRFKWPLVSFIKLPF